MEIQKLPNGMDASLLKFPVEYNVAGLFVFSKLLFLAIEMVKEKYDYDLPIKYIYGSPNVVWNGGRFVAKDFVGKDFSLREIEEEMIEVKERGITPLLTFSNTLIEKQDLLDRKANDVLKIAKEINGEIIVTNELLEKYIRDKYPELKIHASVIKTVFAQKRDEEYYNELSKNYSKYVVHPDDNFNLELLKKIPKENAEILINERCMYQCKLREQHYRSISKEQILFNNGKYESTKFMKMCKFVPENKQFDIKERNISLTVDELEKVMNLGFKNIKIQGRTDNLYSFFFDLFRYSLENGIVFPTTFPIFNYYIEKFLKK